MAGDAGALLCLLCMYDFNMLHFESHMLAKHCMQAERCSLQYTTALHMPELAQHSAAAHVMPVSPGLSMLG